jgi:L-iditol 2-dehydrogenase
MTNQAAFMTGLRQMEIREIPMPEPGLGEVLVKLAYVGICGSDVHYYEHGRIGDFVVKGDFILGHECAGTVVKLGSGVSSLQPGDEVALEPGATCGHCEFCTSGRYNLCPDVKFLATPPYDGCFMNYIAYPAHLAFKLPRGLSAKEGALVEPLSVGLEAAMVGGVGLGSSVAILGGGCIGLMSMLAARARGATNITVVDLLDNRLEKARELGADHVFNGAKTDWAQLLAPTNGQGYDVVMETAGSAKTLAQTVDVVKRGGTIVAVGMGAQDVIPYDFGKLMGKVAQIKTIFRYKNQYPVALTALASGKIDVKGIVSNEFAFADIAEAFRVNIEDRASVVKIVIRM